MSVIKPNDTARTWQMDGPDAAVLLYVGEAVGDIAAMVEHKIAGFPMRLSIVAGSDWIDPSDLANAPAAVIQVDAGNPASIKRFQQLSAKSSTPLIAASYEPPLALVRSLVRAGAHDVIPLPLSIDDLETSLGPIRDELAKSGATTATANGKLVTAIKSVGGVGATALLTQLAIRVAQQQAGGDKQSCLVDLDVQFGDVAFQLGLQSKLTLVDLLEAGNRLDTALLRSTTTEHSSGLNVISAPKDMMPIEGMPNEQLLQIVELATRAYANVFVDLPANWTNWSLSLVARSHLVLLITELSVAGLNRARRQLDLLHSQDLQSLDVRVVINRFEKSQTRTIRAADVREALGRDVNYYIANDFQLMRSAIDRGVPIEQLKRKSALGRDLDLLANGVIDALGTGR